MATMNTSDTLSVDPGRTTLGALHPEMATQFLRKKIISRPYSKSGRKNTLDFIFASAAPRSGRIGAALLFLRLAFASILIVSGSFITIGEINPPETPFPPSAYAISQIAIGAMLALGLFTRFAMAASIATFAIMAGQSIAAGIFTPLTLTLTLASATFLILGSGKYSADFLIRKALILHASRRRRHPLLLTPARQPNPKAETEAKAKSKSQRPPKKAGAKKIAPALLFNSES